MCFCSPLWPCLAQQMSIQHKNKSDMSVISTWKCSFTQFFFFFYVSHDLLNRTLWMRLFFHLDFYQHEKERKKKLLEFSRGSHVSNVLTLLWHSCISLKRSINDNCEQFTHIFKLIWLKQRQWHNVCLYLKKSLRHACLKFHYYELNVWNGLFRCLCSFVCFICWLNTKMTNASAMLYLFGFDYDFFSCFCFCLVFFFKFFCISRLHLISLFYLNF